MHDAERASRRRRAGACRLAQGGCAQPNSWQKNIQLLQAGRSMLGYIANGASNAEQGKQAEHRRQGCAWGQSFGTTSVASASRTSDLFLHVCIPGWSLPAPATRGTCLSLTAVVRKQELLIAGGALREPLGALRMPTCCRQTFERPFCRRIVLQQLAPSVPSLAKTEP